jgi:hypothetical protein
MAEAGLVEQLAQLNSTLHAVEARFAHGEVRPESLSDFKSSIDDFRLRVWGLLSAASADDSQAFQERFRIRRAKELCRSLDSDLRARLMSARHEELPELGTAAVQLAQSIQEARSEAF